MSINVMRGETDETLEQILVALRPYEADHQGAQVDVYRQDPYSIRVRVIDAGFASMGLVERNDQVWQYFKVLPDDTQSDISTLLTLTPDEVPTSFGNMEFENPVPSVLL